MYWVEMVIAFILLSERFKLAKAQYYSQSAEEISIGALISALEINIHTYAHAYRCIWFITLICVLTFYMYICDFFETNHNHENREMKYNNIGYVCTHGFTSCLNPGGAVKHSGDPQQVRQKHKAIIWKTKSYFWSLSFLERIYSKDRSYFFP